MNLNCMIKFTQLKMNKEWKKLIKENSN